MEGQGNPTNKRAALSLAAVPSDSAISLAAVPGDAALSLAVVPGDAALSLAAVPGDAALSLAAVPGDAALSLAAVPGDAATVPGGSMDFLSYLPDHLLVRILLELDIKDAVKTSALSRRWPAVWAQLPVLIFSNLGSSVPATVLAAYGAHGEHRIDSLSVFANRMDARHASNWLSLATPLLSGPLFFDNSCTLSQRTPRLSYDDAFEIELPAFKRATRISMDLGFLGLALPPAGVFDALTVMQLEHFQFRGQLSIMDGMFPSLEELTICRVRGLVGLTLQSPHLLCIHVSVLPEVQQIEIQTPKLNKLEVMNCFYDVANPYASIAAERLTVLRWEVPCIPVLGEMPLLRVLGIPAICTYWPESLCAAFLSSFPSFDDLEVQIILGPWTDGSLLPMKEIRIPSINALCLWLDTNGHSFEGRVVQLLTNSCCIQELNIIFQIRDEAQDHCCEDCLCHSEPFSAGATADSVRGLRRVIVFNFQGSPREVNFLDEVVRRASKLTLLKIFSEAKDHCLEGIEEICPPGCIFEIIDVLKANRNR